MRGQGSGIVRAGPRILTGAGRLRGFLGGLAGARLDAGLILGLRLRRRFAGESALADLRRQLVQIDGLPAVEHAHQARQHALRARRVRGIEAQRGEGPQVRRGKPPRLLLLILGRRDPSFIGRLLSLGVLLLALLLLARRLGVRRLLRSGRFLGVLLLGGSAFPVALFARRLFLRGVAGRTVELGFLLGAELDLICLRARVLGRRDPPLRLRDRVLPFAGRVLLHHEGGLLPGSRIGLPLVDARRGFFRPALRLDRNLFGGRRRIAGRIEQRLTPAGGIQLLGGRRHLRGLRRPRRLGGRGLSRGSGERVGDVVPRIGSVAGRRRILRSRLQ